jgi:hypothetical protein
MLLSLPPSGGVIFSTNLICESTIGANFPQTLFVKAIDTIQIIYGYDIDTIRIRYRYDTDNYGYDIDNLSVLYPYRIYKTPQIKCQFTNIAE